MQQFWCVVATIHCCSLSWHTMVCAILQLQPLNTIVIQSSMWLLQWYKYCCNHTMLFDHCMVVATNIFRWFYWQMIIIVSVSWSPTIVCWYNHTIATIQYYCYSLIHVVVATIQMLVDHPMIATTIQLFSQSSCGWLLYCCKQLFAIMCFMTDMPCMSLLFSQKYRLVMYK